MDKFIYRLELGERYFGSGCYNTEEFNKFFEEFKKSFTNQLRKLKAKEISFNKGHFNLYGFFKVGDQYYYFSLSDVRDGVPHYSYTGPELLVRTAEGPEDYTGGSNNFIPIKNGMWKRIAKVLRIELPKPAPSKKKSEKEIALDIIKKGFGDMYVGSMRRGNSIAWEVDRLLNDTPYTSLSIQVFKNGNWIRFSKTSTEKFGYRYDGDTKRIQIDIYDTDFNADEFLKTLSIGKKQQYRVNPFTGEGETLEPTAVALYDYIKDAEVRGLPLFRDALLLFREKYPNAYMTLLD